MTDLRKAAEEAAKVLANALSIDFNDKRDWYSYKHDVEYAANLLCQALAQPEQEQEQEQEQEPEIVRRVRRYAGKRRESVSSPHINAKECIALANWIESKLKENNNGSV